MPASKRGFVFYFDSCPAMNSLPPDQRGWLISALCDYADRIWRDPTVTLEEILELYPDLSSQGEVALKLLASGVSRDTYRWLKRREASEQRRAAAAAANQAPKAAQVPPKNQDYLKSLQKLAAQMQGSPGES